MELLLAIPLPIRLLSLFLLGAALGSWLNLGIYRLAMFQRWISPWSPVPPNAPPRTWQDRLPLLGWWRLRRESNLHGAGFWIRPLLIELSFGIGLAWLYWWEVVRQSLYAHLGLIYPIPPTMVEIPPSILHAQFVAHALLLGLMVVATFIDIDEKTIPDAITVPGTLLALIFAVVYPWSLLGQIDIWTAPRNLATELQLSADLEERLDPDGFHVYHEVVTLVTPRNWPADLNGAPQWKSLAVGLGCFLLWCFALAPRPWYIRHGLKRAFQVSTARFLRSIKSPPMPSLLFIGVVGTIGIWWRGGDSWAGLLTALIGMAASGGVIWLVRIIGAVTLRKEAMGFGDVLLMMMFGAFIGWQAGLVVFFLAPGAGLVVGVFQLILRHDDSIPYGPFLCLATLAVIGFWADVWLFVRPLFDLGAILPMIFLGCLAAMTVMLFLWKMAKDFFLSRS